MADSYDVVARTDPEENFRGAREKRDDAHELFCVGLRFLFWLFRRGLRPLQQFHLITNLLALVVLVEQCPQRKARRERLVKLAQNVAIMTNRIDQVLSLSVVHQLGILFEELLG